MQRIEYIEIVGTTENIQQIISFVGRHNNGRVAGTTGFIKLLKRDQFSTWYL